MVPVISSFRTAMHSRLTSLAFAIVCLLLVSGCAESARQTKDFFARPFRKTPEEIYGIKTPKDRVKEFRQLAKAAGEQSPEEQAQSVARLVRDYHGENDGWVRREILRTLAEYQQPEAGAVLVEALGDASVQTRVVACEGLGKRGDEIAVRELVRVLGSETNDDVRMAATSALGDTGSQTALAPLSEALVTADPAMRAQAQQALVEISGHDYGDNVQAWRELAQQGHTEAAEISFAEKLRQAFY
jgi:HEAT repeat protein